MNNKVAVEVCLVESPARDGEVGSVDAGGRLAVAVGTSVSVTKTSVAKVGLGLSLPLAVVVSTEGGVTSDQTSGGDGRGGDSRGSDGRGSKNGSGVAGDRDVSGVDARGRLGDGNGGSVGSGGNSRGSDGGSSKTSVASSKEQGLGISLSLPLAVVVSTEGGVASDQTSAGDGRGSKNGSSVAGDGDVGSVDAGGRLANGNGGSVGSGGNSGGSGDGRGSDGGASVAKTKTRVASSQEQGVSLSGDQGGGANHNSKSEHLASSAY